jgi:hypothetical protein
MDSITVTRAVHTHTPAFNFGLLPYDLIRLELCDAAEPARGCSRAAFT